VRLFAESAFAGVDVKAEDKLRQSTELLATKFFKMVLALPNGLETLVMMRKELLDLTREKSWGLKIASSQTENPLKVCKSSLCDLIDLKENPILELERKPL